MTSTVVDQDLSALSISEAVSAREAEYEDAREAETESECGLNEQLKAGRVEIAALKSEISALRAALSDNRQATTSALDTGGAKCSSDLEDPREGIETAVWKELFDELDQDRKGELSHEQLKAAMRDDAHLFLSRSHKLRDLMEEFKMGKRVGVGLEEFGAVMKDLFVLRYKAFFKSTRVDLQLAAAAWKHITGEDGNPTILLGECSHMHAFQSFKLKTHQERVDIFKRILIDSATPLAERMAREVVAAAEYEVEQEAVPGKFAGMELGDALCFDCGIDVLGLPDLHFEEGISREHASEEPFQAWNNGVLRTTSAKEQMERVLPDGWAGRVNNMSYAGDEMCDDFEEHEMAKAAGLSKAELVMCRLYTGPMYIKYNSKLRALLQLMKKHWTGAKAAAAVREALEKAMKELRPEFVTSILVLVSALLKLRTVSRLPPNRKVYRGMAGRTVPESFTGPDERGNRGGVEFGFLSTSSSKAQAVGYINFEHGMPQLYEIQVGQIDRGAAMAWISYFPGEEEVLLPPLCSLEANGDATYEDLTVKDQDGVERVRKVMVWPVRINVNLKGKTIDEHKANRKRLHAQMADNALGEVGALMQREEALDAGEEALRATIQAQCEEVVHDYRERADTDLNDDTTYSTAIQDVLMLLPWATGLIELKRAEVAGLQELSQLQLSEHLPSFKLRPLSVRSLDRGSSVRSLDRGSSARSLSRVWSVGSTGSNGSAEAKGLERVESVRSVGGAEGRDGSAAIASAALAVCQQRGLVVEHLEAGDAEGSTALARSSKEGKRDDAELLLLSCARVDARDKCGYTPLMRACENAHQDTARLLAKEGTAMLLLEHGAQVKARSEDGMTALFLACRAGFEAAACRLAEAGADVNARHKCGFTPLMRAALRGLEPTARMLLAHGAHVNASNDNGDTALILACQNGHEATAMMLVELGADVNAANRDGHTALLFARGRRLEGAARLLVEKGAWWPGMGGVEVEAVQEESLPSGPYYIELLAARQPEAAKGAALFAHNVLPADRRDADATWVCVHDAKQGAQSQWRLEPAGNGAYYIELVGSRLPNAPTGASLHVYDGQLDGTPAEGSTWVSVHDDKLGCNSQWRFVPAETGNGAFYIELVGPRQAGAAGGASLHVWNDQREGDVTNGSTWACVHDNKYGEGSQWRLVPVSAASDGDAQAEGRCT